MNKSHENKMEFNKDSVSYESYEQMAEHYFSFIDTKPYNAYYERPGTLSLISEVEGKKVLDAGCAAGWYTKWFLDRGADVTSVDFSPQMIEMTKKRVGDKALVKRADLNEPLDFIPDDSKDIIVSSLTLHYLKSWDVVMKEFKRILKDTGELIISVHHPFMDFMHHKKENYFLTELLEEEWGTINGKVKVQFYRRPLSEIISSITKEGFIIEKIIEPMPTEEFRKQDPIRYEKLTKKPQFLFIRARKVN